jgi:glutamate formiminotransferase
MLLEAVPNFSEGRDPAVIDALAAAAAIHARLLNVHADADHNRTVLTLVAEQGPLVAAVVAAARVARERIDLRTHDGVHPCVGVADVLPIVPLRDEDMPAARDTAHALARALAESAGLSVFFYGAIGHGRRPAFFRKGGLTGLRARVAAGELAPDRGPREIDPAAGAALVGARPPLVAFNVNLATSNLDLARAVAAAVREAGGGFPGVRALGLPLPRAGCVQVSMNIEDWQAAPPHAVVARIRELAAAAGVAVLGSELIGLLPAGAAALAARDALGLPGLTVDGVLEARALQA